MDSAEINLKSVMILRRYGDEVEKPMLYYPCIMIE